jgi:3'-5' exonuclease
MLTYHPTDFRRVFVDDDATLGRLVPELAETDALGVDLEMVQRVDRQPGGLQVWRHVLSLIQIARQGLSVVVDPLRCEDLSVLGPVLAGPIRKIFLGGGQDTALLKKSGIPPRNVVDVGEVALGIFGRREDGMAALAQRIFGISLDKTVRRTDWSHRPLDPALVTYAHRDAELTLLIYRWFQETHPEAVVLHERSELEPPASPRAAPWLRECLEGASTDPLVTLAVHRLRLEVDRDKLSRDVQHELQLSSAPRQINRLLRIAGDLELRSLLPDAATYLSSRSSLLRTAAARAIGRLADREQGTRLLLPLASDPVEDVRKVAEAARRELDTPAKPTLVTQVDDEPGLDEENLAKLEELRRRLKTS